MFLDGLKKLRFLLKAITIEKNQITLNLNKNVLLNVNGITSSKSALSFLNSDANGSIEANLIVAIANARHTGLTDMVNWLSWCKDEYLLDNGFFSSDKFKEFNAWYIIGHEHLTVTDNMIFEYMETVKTNSTCARHAVACIVTDSSNRVLGLGWNGVVSGSTCQELFPNEDKLHIHTGELHQEWSKKNELHAEVRALDEAISNGNGHLVNKIFVTHSCCSACSTYITELIDNDIIPHLAYIKCSTDWSNDDHDKLHYAELQKKVSTNDNSNKTIPKVDSHPILARSSSDN